MKRTIALLSAVIVGLLSSGIFLVSPALATTPKLPKPQCSPSVPEAPVDQDVDKALKGDFSRIKICYGAEFTDTCDGVSILLKSEQNFQLKYKINDTVVLVSKGEDKKLSLGKEDHTVYLALGSHWFLVDKHKWVEPKGCASTAPSPSPSKGATLPVTGSKTPIAVGFGVAFIVAGVVIFIATRRKRDQVEFTAE